MIKDIIEKIQLPKEMADQVIECDKTLDYKVLSTSISLLYQSDTWDQGRKELEIALGEDPYGVKILTVMLHCANLALKEYKQADIDEGIYTATMNCFTRFVEEYKTSFGCYGFDRAFWTTRQISMSLFRIGVLEYELTLADHKEVVSLHIPSDSVLTLPNLRDSYLEAKKFLAKYYPNYGDAKMICSSWLLSPSLKDIITGPSKILDFQKSFIINSYQPEEKDYLEWVYRICGEKSKEISLSDLPEKTSLQKNMKNYLLEGGKVGLAAGVLMEEPFLD